MKITKDNAGHGGLIICHECDALQHVSYVMPGKEARCVRCGFRLFRNPKGGVDKLLALTITSMILFVIANLYPVMMIKVAGIERSASITETALAFVATGNSELAVVVWLSSVFIPGFIIFGMFYVLFSIRFRLGWAGTGKMLVWLTRLVPWAMLDVYLLGVFVALVKLISLADIMLTEAFYALLVLMYTYAATMASFEPYILWNQLDQQSSQRAVPDE